MLNRLQAYISRHHLLGDGKYLVALSGGADSVCLLRVMLSLGYDVEAVHCNFRLRGEESDRDEQFCVELCQKHHVPLHITHFDTTEYAALHKVSIEMAARQLRYDYFERLRTSLSAQSILVAHHRDDSIETLLLNLVRGTGIRGMEGIKPRNGHILRPLLCVSREDILAYLREIGQDYITDSSNLVDDVQRNYLRLHVLPELSKVAPRALDNITTSMEHLSEAVRVYDAAIAQSVEECYHDGIFSIPALRRQPSPESTLYEVLRDYGFSSRQVQQIYEHLDAPVGKIWSSDTHILAKDRDTLILNQQPARNQKPGTSHKEPETRNQALSVTRISRAELTEISRDPLCATIDADRVTMPLTVRTIEQGDRFVPYGMKGSKLVSDYLTDRKRDYFQKQRQKVVEDATHRIVWLIGERVSDLVAITPDTINVLVLRYS